MRHYLDFAATAAVRPQCVVDAVTEFLSDIGATPGRGGYGRALDAGRMVLACRRAVSDVLGVEGDPGRLAFMGSATLALNTALAGLLAPGDTVVVTTFDHNAVLRPLDQLASSRAITVRMVSGQADGSVDLAELAEALVGAKLLVVNHVSNVLGTCLPVAAMTDAAHASGATVLVDAAQALGHIPVTYGDDGVDVVVFTGHKGLLGPQGTGGLWVRPGIELEPLVVGGSGGHSESRRMPTIMPDRLEAGSLNAPGLAGLLAGCGYVLEAGVGSLQAREGQWKALIHSGLSEISGVRVLSPAGTSGVGIVLFECESVPADIVAERLDRDWGVACRSGLHCAPEVHRMLGTLDRGAVRLSVGWATQQDDIDQVLRGVRAISPASDDR